MLRGGVTHVTNGHISNVGPCWFFPAATSVVFDLGDEEGGMLDEVYHGTWFNEYRRLESIKAHAALGVGWSTAANPCPTSPAGLHAVRGLRGNLPRGAVTVPKRLDLPGSRLS